ncbi:hypothetical protein GCM10011352_26490 [Marinobacterium zhoushanense]|uniref:Uncharacterized protein n=1 Tax=Marinobacterium zhoushanense TaxID=1679163 RepID=A0ABQ1KH77_9GAMM|nr:hypothetical protein [Marinobacterium zhoushanense]GGB99020.1 hypothetical protein GCM10011352_26490 [Marinobacterium zhoushanense]
MKEFMYALALCLLMASGWSISKAPSERAIKAAPDAATAAQLEQERGQIRAIAGGALVLALVCGVVGWRSKSREDADRKKLD